MEISGIYLFLIIIFGFSIVILFFRLIKKLIFVSWKACFPFAKNRNGPKFFYWIRYLNDKTKLFLSHYFSIRHTFGYFWEISQDFVTIIAIIIFIIEQYYQDNQKLFSFEIVMASFFAIDYLMRFLVCDNKMKFFYSKWGLIDFATFMPVFIAMILSKNQINDELQVLRALRVLRILRVFRFLLYTSSEISRQILKVGLTFIALILITSTMIRFIEKYRNTNELNFHDSIYFIIVSITTVGYGDITPGSDLGRLVVVIMLLVTLFVVPYQISELSSLVSSRTAYLGSYSQSKKAKHIVLSGDVTYSSLFHFAHEFFYSYNSREKVNIVVLMRNKPSHEIKQLLRHPKFHGRIQWLNGSPIDEHDLLRADIHSSWGFFTLANKFSTNVEESDSKNIFSSLVVRQISPETPIFAQSIRSISNEQFRTLDVERILCVDILKNYILAMSCLSPGFSTLIFNLLRSYASFDVSSEQWNIMQNMNNAEPDWEKECFHSSLMKIYVLKLPKFYEGRLFSDISTSLRRVEICVFGVAVLDDSVQKVCVMNPGSTYKIQPDDVVFILADSKEKVEQAFFNSSDEKDYLLAIQSNDIQIDNFLISSKTTSLTEKLALSQLDISKEDNGMTIHPQTNESLKLVQDVINEKEIFGGKNSDQEDFDPKNFHLKKFLTKGSPFANEEMMDNPFSSPRALIGLEDDEEQSHPLFDSLDPETTYLDDEPHSLESCTLENCTNFRGHIIITGCTNSLHHFVACLRSRRWGKLYPVVIFNPDISTNDWREVSRFPDVYYLAGNIKSSHDLSRVGVDRSGRVIILTNKVKVSENLQSKSADEFFVDADNIFAIRGIESRENFPFVISEIVHSSNLCYMKSRALNRRFERKAFHNNINLQNENENQKNQKNQNQKNQNQKNQNQKNQKNQNQKNQKNQNLNQKNLTKKISSSHILTKIDFVNYVLHPYFVSGRVFLTSVLDELFAWIFWVPDLLPVLSQLIIGTHHKITSFSHLEIQQSKLFMMKITSRLIGKEFSFVYKILLDEFGILPIAIYRSGSSYQNPSPFPYVYTNPRSTTILFTGDRLFVLAPDVEVIRRANEIDADENQEDHQVILEDDDSNENEKLQNQSADLEIFSRSEEDDENGNENENDKSTVVLFSDDFSDI